ncbi:hypothetical protein Q1695_016420 [Nippostrongylus brasiliensis]|nr:hypothetical protein Q1695_016420 [Nippostrongylus brasiliensis]
MNNFLVLPAFFAAIITTTAGEQCRLKGADVTVTSYHRSILTGSNMDCNDISKARNNAGDYCTLTSKLSKSGYRRSTPTSAEINGLLQGLGLQKMKTLHPTSYGCELLHESYPMFAGRHVNTFTLKCVYKYATGFP